MDFVPVHRFPVRGFRWEQVPPLLALDFLLDLARHRLGQGFHLDLMDKVVVVGKKEKKRGKVSVMVLRKDGNLKRIPGSVLSVW